MASSSTRPTNELGRHILPDHRPRAVDTAQRPFSPLGVPSPFEVPSPFGVSNSFGVSISFGVSSCRTTLEHCASQPRAAGAAPGPSSTRAVSQAREMAVSAPESAAMERQASRPYINNHTAPPYRNSEEAIKHQSATITFINREMDSGPRLNTTDAAYTTDDANEPSGQLPEPEDATRPGQAGAGTSSPLKPCRKMEAALALLEFSQAPVVFGQNRAQRAMAQSEPNHGSPATRSPDDEAVAPVESTEDTLEVPQQHAPQQGQWQGQQGPREFKRTGEDDGHTDGSASSVLTNSGSRRPLPNSGPLPTSSPLKNSKPQSKGKRKRVEEKEEPGQEKESESGTKKVVKANGGKPKGEKEYKFVCPDCGGKFTRNDHLTRHVETVHGIEMEGGELGFARFPCGLCSKRFTRKDNLKTHRNTTHPDRAPAPVPKSVFVDADDNIIAYAPALRLRSSRQTARPELPEPISGSSSPLKRDQEEE